MAWGRRRLAARAPCVLGIAACVLLTVALAAPAARAQQFDHLDVNLFHPAAGSARLFVLPTAEELPPLQLTAQVLSYFAPDLLGITRGGVLVGAAVKNRFTTDVAVAAGFLSKYQLTLTLPVTLYQEGNDPTGHGLAATQPRGAGDLRSEFRAGLLRSEWSGLGAALELVFPTGAGDQYLGSGNLTGSVKVFGHLKAAWFRAALTAGWRFAVNEQRFGSTRSGNSLLLAAGVAALLWHDESRHAALELTAETWAQLHYSFVNKQSMPVEFFAALQYRVSRAFAVYVGAGTGITAGLGQATIKPAIGLSGTWEPELPAYRGLSAPGTTVWVPHGRWRQAPVTLAEAVVEHEERAQHVASPVVAPPLVTPPVVAPSVLVRPRHGQKRAAPATSNPTSTPEAPLPPRPRSDDADPDAAEHAVRRQHAAAALLSLYGDCRSWGVIDDDKIDALAAELAWLVREGEAAIVDRIFEGLDGGAQESLAPRLSKYLSDARLARLARETEAGRRLLNLLAMRLRRGGEHDEARRVEANLRVKVPDLSPEVWRLADELYDELGVNATQLPEVATRGHEGVWIQELRDAAGKLRSYTFLIHNQRIDQWTRTSELPPGAYAVHRDPPPETWILYRNDREIQRAPLYAESKEEVLKQIARGELRLRTVLVPEYIDAAQELNNDIQFFLLQGDDLEQAIANTRNVHTEEAVQMIVALAQAIAVAGSTYSATAVEDTAARRGLTGRAPALRNGRGHEEHQEGAGQRSEPSEHETAKKPGEGETKPWEAGREVYRHERYQKQFAAKDNGKPPLEAEHWWEKWGRKQPNNKWGGKGNPAHQAKVAELEQRARSIYPEDRYDVRREAHAPGLDRFPDVTVVDRQTRKVVKVYEAARFNKRGKLIRPDERAKLEEYRKAGIPCEFHPVGPNAPPGGVLRQ